jgi:hypothetical protein
VLLSFVQTLRGFGGFFLKGNMDNEEFLKQLRICFNKNWDYDMGISHTLELINSVITENKYIIHKPMSDEDFKSDKYA